MAKANSSDVDYVGACYRCYDRDVASPTSCMACFARARQPPGAMRDLETLAFSTTRDRVCRQCQVGAIAASSVVATCHTCAAEASYAPPEDDYHRDGLIFAVTVVADAHRLQQERLAGGSRVAAATPPPPTTPYRFVWGSGCCPDTRCGGVYAGGPIPALRIVGV
jgi:hypothetical protein